MAENDAFLSELARQKTSVPPSEISSSGEHALNRFSKTEQ